MTMAIIALLSGRCKLWVYDRYCLSLCFNVHQLTDTSFAVDFSNVHHGKAWVWFHVGGHCKCHQEDRPCAEGIFWVSCCAPKSKQDSQRSHDSDHWDALCRGCAWRCYQGMAGVSESFGSEEVGHGVWRGWSRGGHHVLSCDNTGKEACIQIHVQHCPGRGTERQRWAAGKGSDPHAPVQYRKASGETWSTLQSSPRRCQGEHVSLSAITTTFLVSEIRQLSLGSDACWVTSKGGDFREGRQRGRHTIRLRKKIRPIFFTLWWGRLDCNGAVLQI